MLLVTAVFAGTEPLDELKTCAAKNKQALAQYSWKEQQTLTVDGDLKRTTISAVVIDANGKPVKTVVSEQDAPQKEVRGPLRKRVRERKADEFKDYVKDVGALTQSYAHLDPEKLQQAFQNGTLMVSSAGAGKKQFSVAGYLKPGDTLTIVYDSVTKALVSMQVSSYLDQPDNVVNIKATFSRLPDGTNHLSESTVIGQDKDVVIAIKNSDYSKRG
jgi:hypothetical protein